MSRSPVSVKGQWFKMWVKHNKSDTPTYLVLGDSICDTGIQGKYITIPISGKLKPRKQNNTLRNAIGCFSWDWVNRIEIW